jgi:hypothetical protein
MLHSHNVKKLKLEDHIKKNYKEVKPTEEEPEVASDPSDKPDPDTESALPDGVRYIGRLDSLNAVAENPIQEVRSIIKSYRRKNLRVPKAKLMKILAPVKEEDSEGSQESAEE